MIKLNGRRRTQVYVAIGCSVAAVATSAVALISGTADASGAAPTYPATIHTLHLQGMPNARDLGGYRTTDGGTVRYGLLFRSGELSHLTTADQAKLASLHLRDIIDLRTPEEESAEPDPTVVGATYINLPVIPAGDPLIDAWNDATTIAQQRVATDSLGGPDACTSRSSTSWCPRMLSQSIASSSRQSLPHMDHRCSSTARSVRTGPGSPPTFFSASSA